MRCCVKKGLKNMKKIFGKKTDPMKKAMEVARTTAAITDPNGSYTGYPENPNEVPVQDADDL